MPPQSVEWKSDRAVLFVHGVGNARPGDYDALVAQVRDILEDDADNVAFYFLYYDQINDWFAAKSGAAARVAKLVSAIRARLADQAPSLGQAFANFAGDVLWPVLLADGRQAVRAAYLSQLQQLVLDGTEHGAGRRPRELRITIIAHSLGCFHTYEALQAAARDPGLGLSPATWGVRIERVIYMASPVQLIRSVAGDIDFFIPQRETLHTLAPEGLSTPAEVDDGGRVRKGVRHTVSITGNLDPVGGHFLRTLAPWAYMRLPDQTAFIDEQQVIAGGLPEGDALAAMLRAALRDDARPRITPANPHDWSAYVERHRENLREWLT